MARKNSKNNKSKSKNNYKGNDTSNKFNEISDDDKLSLQLLEVQLLNILFGIYTNTLAVKATFEGANIIYSKYTDDPISPLGQDYLVLQIANQSLFTQVISTQLAFMRYEQLYEQKMRGEFDYTLQPNIDFIISNILSLIAGFYFINGVEGNIQRDSNQPTIPIR